MPTRFVVLVINNKPDEISEVLIRCLLTRQKMTDTLCGTKVIYKSQFQKIKESGLIEKLPDPFCDFTLILGAKLLGLRIVEVPVVYKKRIYDGTKIRRFKDGWKLLKICFKYSFNVVFKI